MTPIPRTRADVVAEARTWLGTPYHLAADVKHHGVDCAMLLLRIYADLGMIEPFDPRPYSSDWMLHRSEEVYLRLVTKRARAITIDEADAGDVVLFRYGRCFSHGGIISARKPLTIIHAFRSARQVVEDRVDNLAEMKKRMGTAQFASYWGR